jgi:hypothetical protein
LQLERHQPLDAHSAQRTQGEAVGQYAAPQELPELAHDERRQPDAVGTGGEGGEEIDEMRRTTL